MGPLRRHAALPPQPDRVVQIPPQRHLHTPGRSHHPCRGSGPAYHEGQENGQIYLEDIRPDTPKINVLNIPWIGRIGLAVCADLLHSEMVDLLVRTLHCNFIICAAYSPGKTLFTRICESSVSYGTTTIWLNACSASSKPEEGVGVIAAPGQNIPLRPECGGNCGGDDAACLFVTELDLRTGEFTPPQHICPLGGTAGT